jgi:hypothetical protein
VPEVGRVQPGRPWVAYAQKCHVDSDEVARYTLASISTPWLLRSAPDAVSTTIMSISAIAARYPNPWRQIGLDCHDTEVPVADQIDRCRRIVGNPPVRRVLQRGRPFQLVLVVGRADEATVGYVQAPHPRPLHVARPAPPPRHRETADPLRRATGPSCCEHGPRGIGKHPI